MVAQEGNMAGRPGGRPGLDPLGWSAEWEEAFAPHAERGLVPGRVAVSYGIALRVKTETGELWAVVPGSLRHRARSKEDIPVVGDWVALRLEKSECLVSEHLADSGLEEDEEGRGAIVSGLPRRFEAEAVVKAVLPRRSRLARKAAGSSYVQQILAANVDYAWLVSALGPDFNPRRMERYLTLAREGNTEPVFVLNKADLVEPESLQEWIAEAEAVAGGTTPVHAISSVTGHGVEALRRYLAPGTTIVLLGSSGVGKSTMINYLLGQDLLDTQEVSEHGRGRHTTTRREMVMLPGGGIVIDTPGIRELQVWEGEKGLEESFPEIEELALSCRFSDCAHETEPGCAVLAAAAEGLLPTERLEAWRKLREEARLQEAQRIARARMEESRRSRGPFRSRRPGKRH